MYSSIRDAATCLETWELRPRTAGVAYIPQSGAAASPLIAELLLLLGQEDEEYVVSDEPPAQPELYDPRQPDLFETDEQREQRVQTTIQPQYTEDALNWVYERILARWEDEGDHDLTEVIEPSEDLIRDRLSEVIDDLVASELDREMDSSIWDEFVREKVDSDDEKNFWRDELDALDFDDNEDAEVAKFLKELQEEDPRAYERYVKLLERQDGPLPWNMEHSDEASVPLAGYEPRELAEILAEEKAEKRGFMADEYQSRLPEVERLGYEAEDPIATWRLLIPRPSSSLTHAAFLNFLRQLQQQLPDVFDKYIKRIQNPYDEEPRRLPYDLEHLNDPEGPGEPEEEAKHDFRGLIAILVEQNYAESVPYAAKFESYLWDTYSGSDYEEYVRDSYENDDGIYQSEYESETDYYYEELRHALGRDVADVLNRQGLREAAPDLPSLLHIANAVRQYSKYGDDFNGVVREVTQQYNALRQRYPYLPALENAPQGAPRPQPLIEDVDENVAPNERLSLGTYGTWPASPPEQVSYVQGSEYFNYLKKVIQKSGPIQWNTFIKSNPWVKEQSFYKELPDPKTGGRYITEESLGAAAQNDATTYDLSYEKWSSDLQNTMGDTQLVVRLDFSADMAAKLGNAANFVKEYLKYVRREFGGHPIGPKTIGHARISVLKNKTWLVDEVQSDAAALLLGELKPQYEDSTRGEAMRFFRSFPQVYETIFGEWEYALMDAVLKMARESGATTVKFATETVLKNKGANPKSSKVKRYYQQLPRNLGFTRDDTGLKTPSGRVLPVWVRSARLKTVHVRRAATYRLLDRLLVLCRD